VEIIILPFSTGHLRAFPCFFLATGSFDNFGHDAIRYDYKTGLPQQGGFLSIPSGEFLRVLQLHLDPLASRFLRVRQAATRNPLKNLWTRWMRGLRSAMPFQSAYTLPEYIPTRLMQFFDILHTSFLPPSVASDFNHLPMLVLV